MLRTCGWLDTPLHRSEGCITIVHLPAQCGAIATLGISMGNGVSCIKLILVILALVCFTSVLVHVSVMPDVNARVPMPDPGGASPS